MAWDHLSITKPHLVYLILGGFTSLFMLCSSVIKERLYIGEATVATICGIIFGPHAANLIDPSTWGNVDLITLEFSRIVLVVQCFAVGVELPRAYMEKHWRSVVLLLLPVMTFGWLITSLFIWGLFHAHLNWLDSLCIAACVTATDPVLASSVVGKGKFAKRVPKHLRDLLSCESGCNDGMAFPFVYLAIYLIEYRPDANQVAYHWFCYTVLYECIFGAFYGFVVGYIARRAIRWAHEKDLIDRESFLVFYFVLALFCAGSGSLLGMDDLLVGFACGVGFSNDGWFLEKTEESHVSNVIDLLINLAFFVYFGSIIPWEQFNSDIIGLSPWRLVVLGILVLFFRRIPIMLMLKPVIPDIKTWREASFAGHFGPIGVGGLFVAILARAELETETTTPLAVLPEPGFEHLNIIEMIWPITCFLVIVSIIVHGSSIAVFTLGKRINTLTISMSYTQANENGPGWMDRLPRIQSRSRSSMARRPSESSYDEKAELAAAGFGGTFLRRQKEDKTQSRNHSRSNSAEPRGRRWDAGRGPGGPISQSAIAPNRRDDAQTATVSPEEDTDTFADAMAISSESSSSGEKMKMREPEEEIYQEGHNTVFEDKEGNVLGVRDSHGEHGAERRRHDSERAEELLKKKDVQHGVSQKEHNGTFEEASGKIGDAVEHPHKTWRNRMQSYTGRAPKDGKAAEPLKAEKPAHKSGKHGPALAYQYGNTIIVEDEDGEVLKKYDIPKGPKEGRPANTRGQSMAETSTSRAVQSLKRMGTHMGVAATQQAGPSGTQPTSNKKKKAAELAAKEQEDDDLLRFTVTAGGRRMSKLEFIQQMSQMNPKDRAKFVQSSDAPEAVKDAAHQDAKDHTAEQRRRAASVQANVPPVVGEAGEAELQKIPSPAADAEGKPRGPEGLTLVDSNNEHVPFHSVRQDLEGYSNDQGPETAAQRRRRRAAEQSAEQSPSQGPRAPNTSAEPQPQEDEGFEGETAAERKRRLGALGVGNDDTPESDSENELETGDPLETGRGTHSNAEHSGKVLSPARRTPGIRFADQPRVPTKDERAAEDAREKEDLDREKEQKRKSGLGRLVSRK
ncbi:Na antiporter 2 [Pyrenophora tritici-repentis]|uniref:Na antiporter n=2 Tax=Pyrenophora tritici-repentis TaxID=45151 RepID=A0A2W1D8V2_9PLEO|nr:Na(+)/H(+) antiporter 2 [Pyrenophora tritici-repentis Pt-1C-BFP]KAA8618952.1 Na(+)/H(+) antiporter 2 [Pyrenophora tritici-repentis]EDU48752.1 Na(+)/H(+) antiporter 2 [Pyrenophora tritici-repentis Pt-1C-BFP]KAF7449395.1 Na antiporter 2 [Pyrenophora tritici-repentis]KAF7570580.1 NhaP, NhaP-type Na+/H+ and K+/H+ antiporter [Pyrenophora tritici-repentis]KAI0577662.1 Na(+)/H(+) antiporter 2 [Pyrenophora tritici-repentis]